MRGGGKKGIDIKNIFAVQPLNIGSNPQYFVVQYIKNQFFISIILCKFFKTVRRGGAESMESIILAVALLQISTLINYQSCIWHILSTINITHLMNLFIVRGWG